MIKRLCVEQAPSLKQPGQGELPLSQSKKRRICITHNQWCQGIFVRRIDLGSYISLLGFYRLLDRCLGNRGTGGDGGKKCYLVSRLGHLA